MERMPDLACREHDAHDSFPLDGHGFSRFLVHERPGIPTYRLEGDPGRTGDGSADTTTRLDFR